MKSSRPLTTFIASGVFALAVSLPAQGTVGAGGSSSATPSGASTKSPVPNQPAKPNPRPHDPTVAAPAANPKIGSGLTPGAANSGSGAGGRETMRPDPFSATDTAGSRPRPTSVASPQFSTLDADRDGRISQAEFTAPSAAWLREGASGAGVGGGVNSTGAAGASDATKRTATPGSSGPLSGPSSATGSAQVFQQIDTNHDGYLSQPELDAYRAPTTSER